MSDTPISNASSFNTLNYDQPVVPLYISQNLERQLADAVEDWRTNPLTRSLISQRDTAERKLAEAIRERDNALSDWKQADADSIRAIHERNEARKQRDLLAAGLRLISDGGLNSEWHAECAKTALATLKGDKP